MAALSMARVLAGEALALLALAGTLKGQATPDSIALRQDCKRVEQILKTGAPASQRGWAAGTAPRCGTSGAEAIASAIRGIQVATDSGRVAMLVAASRFVTDADIFNAGIALTRNLAMPDRLRIAGLEVLILQESPSTVVDELKFQTTDPTLGSCGAFGSVTDGPLTINTPLPVGHIDAAIALVRSIVDDPGTLGPLRSAAACTAFFLTALAGATSN